MLVFDPLVNLNRYHRIHGNRWLYCTSNCLLSRQLPDSKCRCYCCELNRPPSHWIMYYRWLWRNCVSFGGIGYVGEGFKVRVMNGEVPFK